jgi:DNA-nicking Smr family endonuclease
MISNDDRRAFTEAMRDVRRLQPAEHAAPARRRAQTRIRAKRAGRQAPMTDLGDAMTFDGADPVAFRRSGVSLQNFRRLRRGRLHIEAEIDLHGLTSAQAQSALDQFIREAVERDTTCVRIVHGKGYGSGPDGPVLKNLVRRRLAATDWVLAFVTADARHGGAGAVVALLKHR